MIGFKHSCSFTFPRLSFPTTPVFSALCLSEAVEDYSGELTLTGSQTAPADSSLPHRAPGLGQG